MGGGTRKGRDRSRPFSVVSWTILPHLAADVGEHVATVQASRGTLCWGVPRAPSPSFGSRRRPLAAIAPSKAAGATSGRLVLWRCRMGIHGVVAGRLRSPFDVGGVPAAALASQGDPLRAGDHDQGRTPAPRHSMNRAGPARRADQVGVLPICRDQRQRFRRPILLNAASPHVLPCTSDSQCSPRRKGEQSRGPPYCARVKRAVSLSGGGGCRVSL